MSGATRLRGNAVQSAISCCPVLLCCILAPVAYIWALYLVQLLFWGQPAGVWELVVRARGTAFNHPPPWCAPPGGGPREDPRIHQNSNLSPRPSQTPKMTPKASQRDPQGYPLDTIFGCFGAPGGNVKTMLSSHDTLIFAVGGGPQRPRKPSKERSKK